MRAVNFATKYFKAFTMPTRDDTFSILGVLGGLFGPDAAEVPDGDAAVGRAGAKDGFVEGGPLDGLYLVGVVMEGLHGTGAVVVMAVGRVRRE